MALRHLSIKFTAPLMRGLHTSMRQCEASPSYTYVPPGSSVSDPAYFSLPESQAGMQTEQEKELKAMDDVPKMTPARKAVLLKMSTKKVDLEPQGGSHYVPPGSSMSDPHYSIKDPVYFVDGSKAP